MVIHMLEAFSERYLHVPGPHVFAGVDAEAGDTVADELVHEFPDLASHVVSALVQVVHPGQLAVAYLQ